MGDRPLIKGVYADWANFSIRIRGTNISLDPEDFYLLDWKASLKPGRVQAKGPGDRGRTVGRYEAEGKLGLYRHASKKFVQALKDADPKGRFGVVEFNIIGQWTPDSGNADEFMDIELRGCRVSEHGGSMGPDDEATKVEHPLDVMRVFQDGACLIGDL